MENYAIIGIMFVTAITMGSTLLLLGRVLRPVHPNPTKEMPYESGVPDVEPPRARFTPRFYVVAMLFVVFDIEAIFLYPWAVAFDEMGMFALVEMVLFLATVFVAYAYVWRRGGLEWS